MLQSKFLHDTHNEFVDIAFTRQGIHKCEFESGLAFDDGAAEHHFTTSEKLLLYATEIIFSGTSGTKDAHDRRRWRNKIQHWIRFD
jgi:hypothetical protein